MVILVEFSINFTYYVFYYQLFVCEISDDSNHAYVSQIFLIIFFHLISESCQSKIRFSSVCLIQRRKFIQKQNVIEDTQSIFNNTNNNTNMNSKMTQKLLLFVLNIIENDSNENEWKRRHSIDSCIRSIALISAFSMFAIEIIVTLVMACRKQRRLLYWNSILLYIIFM